MKGWSTYVLTSDVFSKGDNLHDHLYGFKWSSIFINHKVNILHVAAVDGPDGRILEDACAFIYQNIRVNIILFPNITRNSFLVY